MIHASFYQLRTGKSDANECSTSRKKKKAPNPTQLDPTHKKMDASFDEFVTKLQLPTVGSVTFSEISLEFAQGLNEFRKKWSNDVPSASFGAFCDILLAMEPPATLIPYLCNGITDVPGHALSFVVPGTLVVHREHNRRGVSLGHHPNNPTRTWVFFEDSGIDYPFAHELDLDPRPLSVGVWPHPSTFDASVYDDNVPIVFHGTFGVGNVTRSCPFGVYRELIIEHPTIHIEWVCTTCSDIVSTTTAMVVPSIPTDLWAPTVSFFSPTR